MESIPIIDLRLLSYADLTALTNSFSSPSSTTSPSLSTSSLSPSRSDDIVVPKIDRSIFNESAGSRKQTYSRLRLAPPKAPLSSPPSSSSRRRGRPRSSPSPSSSFAPPSAPFPSSPPDDACCWENRQILLFLRQLFEKNGMHQTLALANPAPASVPAVVPNAKKRGRKKKARSEEEAGVEVGDGAMLNANGVEVDFVALGMKGDLFEEEIMRRTAGLATEEGLLGFMNRLEGKWATARKRRRIVDAGGFGDGLPKGWKLLLALKRKDGKIWLHCRRYLSPSGKQFATCKEVSRYMLSIVEAEVATNFLNVDRDENASLSAGTARSCQQATGLAEEGNYKMETTRFSSGHPGELGDLCKSPVLSSVECRKCTSKFPDKTTCDQHSLTCHSSSNFFNGEPVSCNVMSETSEALPLGPAELKPYSPVPVLLLPQDTDLQIQSESFEALPRVGSAESRPSSFLDEFSLASSETKAENICENNNVANDICSSGVHQSSDRLLDSVEIQMNGDDSYHLRSKLSNCATDLCESDHCDSQSNKCNSTLKGLKNETENFRKVDVDISNHVNGNSDLKTDLLIAACEMAHSSILDSAHRDSAETLDANIEENATSVQNLNSEANAINARNVGMDINADIIYSQNVQKSKEGDYIADDTIESLGGNIEENHMALQNLNYETDAARDIHPNTHVDIMDCDNDQWSREGDSPAKDTDDSLDDNTEENHRSPENPNRETDTFSIKDINMDTDADIDYDQNDQRSKKGELILSKNYGGSIDTWVTHYNSSYDNFQCVELNIVPNTAEESSLPDHGCRMEETGLHVPEVSTSKSVDSLADNTMGGLLRNSSEMDNMHVFDASYDKSFMMPSTSSVDPRPVDTPSLHKFDCINRINAKLGYSVESCDVGYRACSDFSTINALETTADVSGGDEVSTQNVLKENSDTMNQLSNNAGLKVHASFRDQSMSSIGIVNPSDVTYTVKDLSVCKVDDTENYHNNCKPNHDSDMTISAIWPPSTENEFFASRPADGLENPICNQQFYLEENLHALQGNGPSYNIQTGSNDVIAGVVEEQRVAAININNYNREEDGLISGHGLSCGNPVANHFVHGNSRTKQGAKEGILPSSSGQGYGITSHMSHIFPCDVHDSFMCHSRNGSNAFEGGLGCSFSGSDKVPVSDISRIAGADVFGSAAGRQPPPWIQPSSYFSSASIVPHQDKNNRHYYTDKRHEHPMGFEGIRIDDYVPPGSSYLANQDSHIKSSQHLTFDYSGNIKNVYAPPAQLDWNTGTPHINAREEITITCIWCGADFSQQGGAVQVQPDSIGFICPNCKAKISGQLKF